MATIMARHKTSIAVLTALGAATLLGGCADRDKFPSLARRPAEDVYRAARATPPAPPPPAVLSQGIEAKLAGLLGDAREAHEAFEAARPTASRAAAAARGAAKGIENWSVASVAIAKLEAARSRVGLPLAELDRMEAEASNRAVDGSDADFKAVMATRQQVEAIAAGETEVIDSLLSQLGR